MMIQERQPSALSGSGYTWDESWILPYESIRSLIHKFAALNQISLPECKRLFRPERGEEGITELGTKLSLEKVSRIIGLGTNLEMNLVDKLVHPTDRLSLVSAYLRTCPICSRHQFHSAFHQILSIKRCPVHLTELGLTTCGACGAHQMYKDLDFAIGKYSVTPCVCAECGQRLWHPYDDAIDSSMRNLLVLTVEQKKNLDALNSWIRTAARTAACGASLERWESMSRLLFLPPPIGMVPHKKSISQIRGAEIMASRGMNIGAIPPAPIVNSTRGNTTSALVQYGFRKARRGKRDRPPMNPQFFGGGVVCSDADKALKESLGPIYKSVRRHIARVFLGSTHRKCAQSIEGAMWWEPGPDTHTPICPWAFAYLFWRRYWEERPRTHHPQKYVNWKYFLSVKLSADHQEQNEWVSLRIFALECYWTFQECVLLARGMHKQNRFSWDLARIRGRLLPYWVVDAQSEPDNPLIHWWARRPIHLIALNLERPVKQHRLDVANQVSIIASL